jgi:GNAT superfamily N-acetyltransferase
MKLELAIVDIPDRAHVADAADYRDAIDVANTVSLHLWGNDDFVYTPEDELATFAPTDFRDSFIYLARLDGLPVGRVVISFRLEEDATTADIDVSVVPAARRHGIGGALLRRAEELAAEGGRTHLSMYSESAVGRAPIAEDVRAASGSRGLPAADPAVSFALANEYTLGQVEVMSQLDLPLSTELTERLTGESVAASREYHLEHWWKRTPNRFAKRFAALRARMVLDVPHDTIVLEPERWDANRVRENDRRMIDRGEPFLTTVAVHTATDELAAYTMLAVPDGSRKVEQYDTLVAAEHRGHRLGMLVKLSNLRELARVAPVANRVITWNAGENDHMLAINDALGFREAGLVGNWQKTLHE